MMISIEGRSKTEGENEMSQRLMVDGFEPFVGKHCETTALKRVLDYHGFSLSEEMLLGLGGTFKLKPRTFSLTFSLSV